MQRNTLSVTFQFILQMDYLATHRVLLWLSKPFKPFKLVDLHTRCQMSVFNYYFKYCDLWLKRTLVFFVCEYLLCNLLNTMIFLNGERFHSMVINMISQFAQVDNLASEW